MIGTARSMLDLRTIARTLGGQVHGRQALVPGPGHGRQDRSLGITLSDRHSEGFVVRSYAGDDWRECRDYVRQRLGLPDWRSSSDVVHDPENARERAERQARSEREAKADDEARRRRSAELWDEAVEPRGTLVERYLASRRLEPPDDGDALRFHPRCPFNPGERHPCMVAAMRTIAGDELSAVHRTALTPAGEKIDRKMLGVVTGTAIKLDGDGDVTMGLAIGEGIETVLAARQLGYRPAWALGSVDAVSGFPVLAGVEALTILEETGEPSARAVQACGTRWHRAGREVIVVRPRAGSDVNDALRMLGA